MARKIWWHGDIWETMIVDLLDKGVRIIYYRDAHRPHDDTLPVYERKAFYEAMGIPYKDKDVRDAETYIELAEAYEIYKEFESGTIHFHTRKDGQTFFSIHGEA